MATVSDTTLEQLEYPTSDGRPMAETDWHRILMMALIQTLELFYAAQRMVYVSGNILVFYEPGNKRKHVSPDVLIVKGVRKRRRHNYLIWAEGKSLDLVIEITSKSTRKEGLEKKFQLYQNILKVEEYFLFDPLREYLNPALKGYRLRRGHYVPIKAIDGRLPSAVLGLHLESHSYQLRLYNPATEQWLPTPEESARQAEEVFRRQAEARLQEVEARLREAEGRVNRLQRELDDLHRR